MEKDDKYFMKLALKEATKAYKQGEIPIGCVLVLNNKIIARGYNKKNSTNVVTRHAEIIAIEKANKKLNNWRLENTILYTTLEPCDMCKNAIIAARIKKVVFGTATNEIINDSNISIDKINNKLLEKLCEKIIKKQFRKIRMKKSGKRKTLKKEKKINEENISREIIIDKDKYINT